MNRDAPHRYLIAYDIADDRRRVLVATRLASYGDRVQFSVFSVEGRPAKLVRLRAALARLVDEASDSILICDLGPTASDLDRRFEVIGRRRAITGESLLIL